jgi:hypothetical protein
MTVRLCLGSSPGQQGGLILAAAVLITSDAFLLHRKSDIILRSPMWGPVYVPHLTPGARVVYLERQLEPRRYPEPQAQESWPLDFTVKLGGQCKTISPFLQAGVKQRLVELLRPVLGGLEVITDMETRVVRDIFSSLVRIPPTCSRLSLDPKTSGVKREVHQQLAARPAQQRRVLLLSYEAAKTLEVRDCAEASLDLI